MKRVLSSLLMVSFLVLGFAGISFAEDFPKITIKLSHNQPVTSPENVGAEAFKKLVEEGSGGRMKVQIFPSMQMGSMREQVEATQMGTLEMSIQPIAVLTPFVKELQIIDFPFLWPSAETLYEVMDGSVGQSFYVYAEKKGLKAFGLWASGFKQFTTANKEIHCPKDFEGLKMRVMPSPLLIEQYKVWGANPIPIEYAELYNALQQGIVDGQENPIQTIAMNKFYEVQNHLIISNHGFLAYLFIANKSWFDRLPQSARDLINSAETKAREVERQAQQEKETEYLEEIKASGIVVTGLTQEEREAFVKASRSVHEEFASTPEMKSLLQNCYEAIGSR